MSICRVASSSPLPPLSGPRCASGSRGPVEALIGTPVVNPEQPVEILRIVHSCDPCIACAVHVTDNNQASHYKIKGD